MTLSNNFHYAHQFAPSVNVQLYVMATGYDVGNAPSGIVSQYIVLMLYWQKWVEENKMQDLFNTLSFQLFSIHLPLCILEGRLEGAS